MKFLHACVATAVVFLCYRSFIPEDVGNGTDVYNVLHSCAIPEAKLLHDSFKLPTSSSFLTGPPSPLFCSVASFFNSSTERMILMSNLLTCLCCLLTYFSATWFYDAVVGELSQQRDIANQGSGYAAVIILGLSPTIWEVANTIDLFPLHCLLLSLSIFVALNPHISSYPRVILLSFLCGLHFCTHPRFGYSLLCPVCYLAWSAMPELRHCSSRLLKWKLILGLPSVLFLVLAGVIFPYVCHAVVRSAMRSTPSTSLYFHWCLEDFALRFRLSSELSENVTMHSLSEIANPAFLSQFVSIWLELLFQVGNLQLVQLQRLFIVNCVDFRTCFYELSLSFFSKYACRIILPLCYSLVFSAFS